MVPPAPIRQALHTTNGDVQGGTTGRGTNSSNRASCGNSISGDEDSDAGHDRRSNYRNSYNSMSNKLHTTSDFVASSNNSTIYRTSTNSNSLAQTSSYISTAAKNGFTTVNDDYSSTLGNTLSSTKKASAEKPARNGPFKFLKKNRYRNNYECHSLNVITNILDILFHEVARNRQLLIDL